MKSNNINVESIAVSLQSRRNYSLLFIDKIQSICEAGRFFMKALLKRLVMYWPVTEYRKICIMKLHTRISREWENFLIMEKKSKKWRNCLVVWSTLKVKTYLGLWKWHEVHVALEFSAELATVYSPAVWRWGAISKVKV